MLNVSPRKCWPLPPKWMIQIERSSAYAKRTAPQSRPVEVGGAGQSLVESGRQSFREHYFELMATPSASALAIGKPSTANCWQPRNLAEKLRGIRDRRGPTLDTVSRHHARGGEFRRRADGGRRASWSWFTTSMSWSTAARSSARRITCLCRSSRPTASRPIPTLRPYMIIDPRAGHGAGIGGFKSDSQVGVALAHGHPVYFVIFLPKPEPGQTLADVCVAEGAFVREIAKRHPVAPKPVIIGNCQGGWAAMLLAASNPDRDWPSRGVRRASQLLGGRARERIRSAIQGAWRSARCRL